MIRSVALVLVLFATAAHADTLPKKSLDECIELALAQQPRLKAAGSTVDAARERVWQSAAAYLPQVTASYAANRRKATSGSLTGGGGSFGGPPSARTFNFYSTGVNLSQVLFDFGQNLALIHRAKALESSAAADAQTEHDAIVFEVTQAYLGLLAAQRLRVVADHAGLGRGGEVVVVGEEGTGVIESMLARRADDPGDPDGDADDEQRDRRGGESGGGQMVAAGRRDGLLHLVHRWAHGSIVTRTTRAFRVARFICCSGAARGPIGYPACSPRQRRR